MEKCIYGMRSVAKYFGVSREKIRWLLDGGIIEPKKVQMGPTPMWRFGKKELKHIEAILKKKKAADTTSAA